MTCILFIFKIAHIMKDISPSQHWLIGLKWIFEVLSQCCPIPGHLLPSTKFPLSPIFNQEGIFLALQHFTSVQARILVIVFLCKKAPWLRAGWIITAQDVTVSFSVSVALKCGMVTLENSIYMQKCNRKVSQQLVEIKIKRKTSLSPSLGRSLRQECSL